jgi:hypothetical protein
VWSVKNPKGHLKTPVFVGDPIGSVGTWNKAFGLQGGAHCESDGFPLLVSVEVI